MPNPFIKTYEPNAFVPTTSFTGKDSPLLLKGENMWVRFGRFGSTFAEGYSGNQDLSETVATKTLTGTIAWTSGSKTITGSGTSFLTELHLGSFVLGDGGAGATQLFVVERIDSNTSFVCSRAPTASSTGKTGYVLPVIFPIHIDRGTAIRGNVVRFPKGHYLGVGDGEFKINGASLSSTFTLSRTPRFALHNPTANTYTQDNVGIVQPMTAVTLSATSPVAITSSTNASPINIQATGHGLTSGMTVTIGGHLINTAANGSWTITVVDPNNFTLTGSTGNGVGAATGYVNPSQMRAGAYNVRVARKNTMTNGFSNPTPPSDPVTLTVGQAILVTFNEAMVTDQDAWDIYATPFEDNSTTTVEARYMGPWYYLKTVTASQLISAGTPTGREVGTSCVISFADSEIVSSQQILTFDNFAPKDSEFCDLLNGIPIYFSCQGKGNSGATSGTSPGPAAIPSKPSNPEGSLLNKTLTTVNGDYIIGEFNAKSRIYVLCQNSLQTIILTTVDSEPIAFRSLWTTGFRNPYNAIALKEYIYAFSTQKFIRSVAGGDTSTIEFEFASDVRDYCVNWEAGHVIVAYDPKNRAVVYFYAAAERRTGYWVTIALPFLIDKQVWNPPIILKKANTDFIVSGAATVGDTLAFVAGGRTSGGAISVGTYVFDGGDSETKDWYLAWNYTDDGQEFVAKTIKGAAMTGKFASSSTGVDVYGVQIEGTFDFTSLDAGTNYDFSYQFGSSSGGFVRKRFRYADAGSFPLYSIRAHGSYTTTIDRLDEVAIKVELNSSVI